MIPLEDPTTASSTFYPKQTYGSTGSTAPSTNQITSRRSTVSSTGRETVACTQRSLSGSDEHVEATQTYDEESQQENLHVREPAPPDVDAQMQNKNSCSRPVCLLYLLFGVLALLIVLWGIGSVVVSILINSTTQMSLKTKTRVMKYIETVNHDKMIGYEILWWSVSITLPILLAVVSAVLAGLNFKDWNPLAPKTGDKHLLKPFDAMERGELNKPTTQWNTNRIFTESSATIKQLSLSSCIALSVFTFFATVTAFEIFLIACYCFDLGLHLYYDGQHPQFLQINSTNSTYIQSPKLSWSQYEDLRLWIVVTGLASGFLLPTATFTGHVLTKGRIGMTDAFSVFSKFVKIRKIKVHGSNHPSIVWCFADVFYVTKRWKRWACAIALWYMLSFFTVTFVVEFGVMGMYQYNIRQGPNCNDTDIWDCFALSRTATGYNHKSPILSHNCSLVQEGDPIMCMRVGDITMAADGLAKALGISTSVVIAYLFMLTVFIKLIARICSSDKMRVYLGGILLLVAAVLVSCFFGMTVIDYRHIFLSYAKQRYQLLNLAALGASVSAILLFSTHETEMLEEQHVQDQQEANTEMSGEQHVPDRQEVVHVPEDNTSQADCVKVVVFGILLYAIPIILIKLDQKFTT